MFEALRLCPHARVIRPDMENYTRVSREVRQMMLALTPLVEPLSIDEAFLDLSGHRAAARTRACQGARALCQRSRKEAAHHRLDRAFLQ
jgi:nucleotidyltransferase/DNA polymerase involved in DNA repair